MRLGKYLSSLTKPELEEIIDKANFTKDEKAVFILLSQGKNIVEISMDISLCERTINRRIICIKNKIIKLEEHNDKDNYEWERS